MTMRYIEIIKPSWADRAVWHQTSESSGQHISVQYAHGPWSKRRDPADWGDLWKKVTDLSDQSVWYYRRVDGLDDMLAILTPGLLWTGAFRGAHRGSGRPSSGAQRRDDMIRMAWTHGATVGDIVAAIGATSTNTMLEVLEILNAEEPA